MDLNTFVRNLAIIHVALLVGLVIFTGLAYWNNPDFTTAQNSNDLFLYLVPVAAVIGYFASSYIFQNRIRDVAHKEELQHKLGGYQTASILKYACLEGATILALIGYYFSGNVLHLVIAVCLILYFFSQRPTQKKIMEDLNLSAE